MTYGYRGVSLQLVVVYAVVNSVTVMWKMPRCQGDARCNNPHPKQSRNRVLDSALLTRVPTLLAMLRRVCGAQYPDWLDKQQLDEEGTALRWGNIGQCPALLILIAGSSLVPMSFWFGMVCGEVTVAASPERWSENIFAFWWSGCGRVRVFECTVRKWSREWFVVPEVCLVFIWSFFGVGASHVSPRF